jgi:hypothetical protein
VTDATGLTDMELSSDIETELEDEPPIKRRRVTRRVLTSEVDEPVSEPPSTQVSVPQSTQVSVPPPTQVSVSPASMP